MKWYRLSAEQGEATAQFNLGNMYAMSKGVPKNYVAAYMWFNLSAESGNLIGINNRDLIAKRMLPEQIAEAQRLSQEWKSTAK